MQLLQLLKESGQVLLQSFTLRATKLFVFEAHGLQ
jgi:hypothetical protein